MKVVVPKKYILNTLKRYCKKYDIDFRLMLSIGFKESKWHDKHKYRYEPGFYRKYLKGNPKYEYLFLRYSKKEISASYGYLQVMYPSAIDKGFKGSPLQLKQTTLNMKYGTIVFKDKLDRYYGDIEKAISAYNAGSATDRNYNSYTKVVLGYYDQYKKLL